MPVPCLAYRRWLEIALAAQPRLAEQFGCPLRSGPRSQWSRGTPNPIFGRSMRERGTCRSSNRRTIHLPFPSRDLHRHRQRPREFGHGRVENGARASSETAIAARSTFANRSSGRWGHRVQRHHPATGRAVAASESRASRVLAGIEFPPRGVPIPPFAHRGDIEVVDAAWCAIERAPELASLPSTCTAPTTLPSAAGIRSPPPARVV